MSETRTNYIVTAVRCISYGSRDASIHTHKHGTCGMAPARRIHNFGVKSSNVCGLSADHCQIVLHVRAIGNMAEEIENVPNLKNTRLGRVLFPIRRDDIIVNAMPQ